MVPRSGVEGSQARTIRQAALIKVSIGEDTDVWVHAVLHGEELYGFRTGFHESLEKTLLVGKEGSSL